MKVIGEKLKIARQIRNKTITELADNANISKQALSQFEKGESEPKTDTLFNLVKQLNFPLSFFTIPYKSQVVQGNTFFRSLRSTSNLARSNYLEKTKLLLGIYDFLISYLEMPELNLPNIDLSNGFLNEEDEYDFDLIAQEVREQWGLGNRPIWNMVDLLEQHGIIMSVLKEESDKIDAFTFTDYSTGQRRYCVMLENEKNSMARRNFSIAHELGHILLHSNINMDEQENNDESIIERQAHSFAASFLLPKDAFNKDLLFPRDYNSYIYLKDKWHVSMKAMFNRAKELGKITQEEYISLLKKYNYHLSKFNSDGERLEPLDDRINIDKPELFETALKTLFEAKVFDSYRNFAEKLVEIGCGVNMDILYNIMSLSENFFEKYVASPIVINLKNINKEG